MKKIIILVLMIALILSLLTGCGKAGAIIGDSSEQAAADGNVDKDTENTGDKENNDNGSGSKKAGGIYKEAGEELGDYTTAVTDAEKPFSKVIEDSLADEDMDTLSAEMSMAIPNLTIAGLGMYDILSMEDLPKEEGKLMLSGYAGVREKNGSEIKFSSGITYDEDKGMNKKGDKISEQGTLNTSTNALFIESKKERDGKVFSRTIMETVILDNGTYLVQYISVTGSFRESDPPKKVAVFKRYNKDEYITLTTTFEGGTDFTYDSIAGKGDLQPDAMARNYTINGRFTVKGGKVEFAKQ